MGHEKLLRGLGEVLGLLAGGGEAQARELHGGGAWADGGEGEIHTRASALPFIGGHGLGKGISPATGAYPPRWPAGQRPPLAGLPWRAAAQRVAARRRRGRGAQVHRAGGVTAAGNDSGGDKTGDVVASSLSHWASSGALWWRRRSARVDGKCGEGERAEEKQ